MARRERPLAAGDTPLLAFARDLRLLRDRAGRPTYRDLAAAAHYSAATLSEAAGGRKLPTLAVALAYVRVCGGDVEQWRRRWHEVAESLAGPEQPSDDRPSPYVGLAAFQPRDTGRFFGRDRLLAQLRERLARRRAVAVFGPSGAGKSSLLRAGLVGGAGERPVLLCTPGTRPWEEVAVHLANLGLGTPGDLEVELAAGDRALHRLVRQALADRPDDTELLIVVDQFEEVFTLCADAGTREGFVDGLITAATADNSRCRVVLGVRADFYAHCTTHPKLIDVLRDSPVVVGPMTTEELREAITKPAAAAGCVVESALVTRLVGDAAGERAALPLVSHALLETWRRRRGTTLTLAGYEEAGGIERAVANTADSVFTALTPAQQTLTRQVFLRLTALGEGTEDTKRRVPRTELDTEDPDLAAVLEHLTRARLLTADHTGIELTHEVLLRSWPRLRGWLTENREGARLHRRLTEATDLWLALDRDPGSLYRGVRLAVTQDWVSADDGLLSAREREFLARSADQEAREVAAQARRARGLRQAVAVLGVLLVVAAVATGYAVRAGNTVTAQRDVALSQKVAAEANAMRATDPDTAAQLALAAYRLAPTVEARGSLLAAFTTPFAVSLRHDVNAAVFSPDGGVLATGGDDRVVRLWDVRQRLRPIELAALPAHADDVESLVFNADGALLFSADYRGEVVVWNVEDPRRPTRLAAFRAHEEAVYRVALRRDNRVLATASADGSVRLWDVTRPGEPVSLGAATGHTGNVWTAEYSPDGRTLATASDDGTARLWDVADPRAPRETARLAPHGDNVTAVSFRPDGRVLATAGFDHTARLWDLTGPGGPVPAGVLTGHSAPLQAVAFSPDGRTAATAGWDYTTRLWNLADPGRPIPAATLAGHTNTVYSLVFGPDGRSLVSASADRTARVTEVPGAVLTGHATASWAATPSPDGRLVATAGEDGRTRLWHVGHPRLPTPGAVLDDATAPVKSTAFSTDGRLLAAGGIDGGIAVYDLADPANPRRAARLAHARSVRSVVFFRDRLLATAGDDATMRLWQLADPDRPEPLGVLRSEGEEGIFATAVSPDGRTAAGVMNRKVRLWDITDPRNPVPLADLDGHTDTATSVAFSPGGTTVATASRDRAARLWDITDPRAPRPVAVLSGHNGVVQSVSFSPDGHTLATASFDHTVRLWDVTTRTVTAVLSAHTDRVYSATFGRDGHTLVTAGEEGVVRLWHTDVERVAADVCATTYHHLTADQWRAHFPDLPHQPPCR
ncbi:hypothetical protein SUDANB95_02663 [Actinosynnema sp. ALI-1.44]